MQNFTKTKINTITLKQNLNLITLIRRTFRRLMGNERGGQSKRLGSYEDGLGLMS